MTVGLASAIANAVLESLVNSAAFPDPAGFYVKLHTGDPGAAGANNAAVETDRVQVTGTTAAGGAISNANDLEWPSVAATEDYSHISFWSAVAAGTFLGSDALNAVKSMDAGDDFTIAAGELDLTLGPIAA